MAIDFEKEFDRTDLAREISKRNPAISKEQALEVLKTMSRVIPDAMVAAQGRVEIHDFGVFRLEGRAARKGRNFKTGELVEIPAHDEIVFNASPAFYELMEQRTGIPTE